MSEDTKTPEAPPAPGKRQYARPNLVEYGPISKLTRTGGATRNEPVQPLMRLMVCL